MKKRLTSLLAALLSLLLLCGCVREEHFRTMLEEGLSEKRIETIARDEEDMPTFGQMLYERPQLEELEQLIAQTEETLTENKSVRTAYERLDACFDFYYHFNTMYTLADIRSCLDLTDEYYAGEYQWCAENYALVQQEMEDLFYACAASPMAKTLEKHYFWEGFVEQYSDESESVYNDATVALMQRESSLIADYRALSADPVIEFRGSEQSIYELMSTLSGEDYNEAVTAYYTQYNERYAEIYIELIAVREELAAALGYDSYEQMQYLYGYERDYTPEQAEAYLRDIRRCMVPLYQELIDSPVLEELWYSRVSEALLRDLIGTAAAGIGGDVAEAYDFMTRYELCDLSVNSRKASMSFQTYLDDYEAPFLFLNAVGDTDDILNFAHEFGHYCDAYVNVNAYETVDLAEVYSQAMEYLILSRLGEQLDEDEVRNIARLKMIDTVDMYVSQASYAEFEHRVYAQGADKLDAETINEISRQTAKDYGYYDAGYDAFYSMSWVDITHFFEQPFYIVSYPISNDLAMQVFALERAEEGSGMERYLSTLERDFGSLMGLVDAGGFDSPFDAGRVEQIAALARELLGL